VKKKGRITQTAQALPTAPEKASRAALSRHKRKCTICQHPQREFIEQEFLHWHSIRAIAQGYNLTDRAIYRHAHAFRLHERRSHNLRFSLGHIIDQVDRIPVTPDSIIQAVRISAHLTNDGRWANPPKHLIVHRGSPA
jgi:hypothetical protein